jgi:hypothetical protein
MEINNKRETEGEGATGRRECVKCEGGEGRAGKAGMRTRENKKEQARGRKPERERTSKKELEK